MGRMIENPDTMILLCKVQRYKKNTKTLYSKAQLQDKLVINIITNQNSYTNNIRNKLW